MAATKKEDENDVDNCIDRSVDHATRDDSVVDTAMRRYRHSNGERSYGAHEAALMAFADEAASSPSQRSNVSLTRAQKVFSLVAPRLSQRVWLRRISSFQI